MRLWHISPAYLDNQRLLAAHQENHALLTCVRKGTKWGIVTDQFKYCMKYPQVIHDATVMEMSIRKGVLQYPSSVHPLPLTMVHHQIISKHYSNPKTAYDIESLPDLHKEHPFSINREHLVKDCQDLRLKWQNESYYFGVGRICLTELEKELGLPLGESKEESLEIHQKIREIVNKTHKEWFVEYRKKHPKTRMQDRIQTFRKQG